MKSDEKIEELMNVNPFVKMLAQLREGGVITDCTEKIGQVIAAVKRTGSKGRLTITLEVIPDDKGEVRTVDIDADVKPKLPERKRKRTTFFVVGEQSLSRTGVVDDQPELDFDAKQAAPAATVTKISSAALRAAGK